MPKSVKGKIKISLELTKEEIVEEFTEEKGEKIPPPETTTPETTSKTLLLPTVDM